MKNQKQNTDAILGYIFLKKLITPIVRSDSYKKGLVNSSGKIIKQPITDDEKESLTLLDRVIFKIKRLLGGKLSTLNQFLWLATQSDSFRNKLVSIGSVQQRVEILRIEKDLKKLMENHNLTFDKYLQLLISEQLDDDQELLKE